MSPFGQVPRLGVRARVGVEKSGKWYSNAGKEQGEALRTRFCYAMVESDQNLFLLKYSAEYLTEYSAETEY